MSEGSPDAVPNDDALNALLERPVTELSVDELMAMNAAYAARGIRIYNSVPWEVVAPLMVAVGIYSKAFLETLGKHDAEALRTRIRKNGETREALVGTDATATIVVTASTPDEARLALLDLDVTADELRGKELRWDTATSAWRPSSVLPAEPGGRTDDEA